MILSITQLVRQRAVVRGARTSGSWTWTRAGEDEPFASIGFETEAVDPGSAWMRVSYTANGNPVDYTISLTTARPRFGGLRWWFLCPLARPEGEPPRRVAKLYLRPGQIYFGSREGYGLTYPSCQESHQRLFQKIVAEAGISEAAVRRALKGSGALLA